MQSAAVNQGSCSSSARSIASGWGGHRGRHDFNGWGACSCRQLRHVGQVTADVNVRSSLITRAASTPSAEQVVGSSKASSVWDYKYQRMPGPTGCQADDAPCQKFEALFQHVLSFPRLPQRVVNFLPKLSQGLDAVTQLVEQMAAHYGKELTYIFISTDPAILNLDFKTVTQNDEQAQQVLGVQAVDMPQVLKKNPALLSLPLEVLRQRYEALPRACRLRPEQAAFLAIKCPSVLSTRSELTAARVDMLHHVSAAREQWLADLEGLSPSLLAFFLRDATDLLLRLEYLASTGERPDLSLRRVFKMGNATFAKKFRHFTRWRNMVVERRKAQGAAQQAARMSAEAVALQASVARQANAAAASSSGSSSSGNNSSGSSGASRQ